MNQYCNSAYKKHQISYKQGTVESCTKIAADVWELVINTQTSSPLAGQFYMLHACPSARLLGRPISVFHSSPAKNRGEQNLYFLILQKGAGTQELCSLKAGQKLNLLGPLGKGFPPSDNTETGKKTALIGGGIGIAPIANLAESLSEKTYDFYACFKTGFYGLDYIQPAELILTTDDGSAGIQGILPCVFTTETIRKNAYSAVYACGPDPMLEYIKKTCIEAGVQCWLSLERRMACGLGACLACSVDTIAAKCRCCKDGPVFDAALLL